jgi:hypothetical protein
MFLLFKSRRLVSAFVCALLLLLTAVASQAVTTLTLAWDRSSSSNVVGYFIYYGPTTGNYTNRLSAGNTTTLTVSNMVEGSTYFFAATALDSNNLESDYSTEVSTTIPIPNRPPTLNPLVNIAIDENSGPQTINLTGISSGATNETQTLTVTASSSNPGLIPNPTVNYTSPNATGTLSLTPAASAFGSATITVTVNDGATTNNTVSRSFTVTVRQVNQPPTISTLPNQLVAMNRSTPVIPFGVGDFETAASNLVVSATSDNLTLLPVANIVLGGSGANRTVTATPATNQLGIATVTIRVSDGTDTSTSSFQLSVVPRPAAPTGFRIVSQGGT